MRVRQYPGNEEPKIINMTQFLDFVSLEFVSNVKIWR